MEDKKYDLILFGVTGFTGKLAVEYLLCNYPNLKWAASARNETKASQVLEEIATKFEKKAPPLLTADLVCDTPEKTDILRKVLQQTRVVLTCSGPFEKYGKTLVELCAEFGVHYADITGETDFFRQMIVENDAKARENGALIVCHCGNDCIPQDLTVFEMHQYALKHEASLKQVSTYVEFPSTASMSGGTAATAAFQLGKDRSSASGDFDPLLQTTTGTKSSFTTKNTSPKTTESVSDLGDVGPWIMGPVMVNCVRRSNALLGYCPELQYGDAQIKNTTLEGMAKDALQKSVMGAAIVAPSLFSRFLPQPGQGPDRDTMEAGYMTLYGRGVIETKSGDSIKLHSKFHFAKDIGYLYTAALLVETGMLLLEKRDESSGGVVTPAVAFGSDLTQRIVDKLDATFELQQVDNE